MSKGSTNIIILAGGASTRFWPLSEKNIYTFFGKTPFQYHLARLKKLNPKKIVVVTNGNITVDFPKIVSVIQRGTGMASGVMTALEKINPEDDLLIMGANDYYEESLFDNFIKQHRNLLKEKEAAIAAYETDAYFPGGYLKLNGDRINGIIEKPPQNNLPSKYVNLVFHFFPKAKTILDSLKASDSKKDDLYEVALDNLMKKGQIFRLIKYTGMWKSIKYPWQTLDVMDFFLNGIAKQNISPKAEVSDKAVIKGSVFIEEGVKIFEGAVINGPVFIGKNSVIANNALVRHSMIGENCVVGYASEVARSYLKDNVWLHKNYVGDSVFEHNVSLGSGTVTGNLRLDEKDIKITVKGKTVDTGRNKLGAIIGSNVRIGINCSLMPGIRIGSGSFVGPGVLLDKDVKDNSFVNANTSFKVRSNKFDISKSDRKDSFNKLK